MTTATIAINILGNAKSLESALSGARDKIKSFGDGLTSVGTKMTMSVTAPIAGMGAVALNSAADFEASMNMIQVSTGASTTDMMKMQAEALRLGAVTSFSAGDTAAAMLELAKSGMTTDEIMSSIGGVLDLAAAGNIDLANAATITSQTLKAFGLDASESANVANMLAAAANGSAAEIPDLTSGLQMASAVANQFGQSADVATAALAILNDNAITGSDAGTSLKTAMMRLYAPTDEARAVLDQLGVSVYDATGAARPLFEVLNEMRSAMFGVNEVTVTSGGRTAEQSARMADLQKRIQGVNTKLADYAAGIAGVAQSENDKVVSVDRLNRELSAMQAEYNALAGIQGTSTTVMKEYTEAERNAMLTTLGGADAMRSLSILLGTSEEEIAAMVGAVNQQGAASDMANARMKGLSGAIEYFKGSIESTLISAVLPFLDGISALIRRAADMISSFSSLSPQMQQFAVVALGIAAAIGPVLLAVGALASTLSWLAGPVIGALAAAFGVLTSPVTLTVAAFAALAAVIWANDWGGVQEKITGIASAFGAWLSSAESVQSNLATIWETFQQFMSGEISLGDLGATLQAEVAAMGETLKGLFTGDAFEQLKADVVAALDLTGIAAAIQLAVNTFDWSGFDLATLGNGIKLAVVGVIASIDWQGAGENVRTFFDGMATSINAVEWTEVGASIGAFFTGIIDGVTGFLTGGDERDKAMGEALNQTIVSAWNYAMTLFDVESVQASMEGFKSAVLGAIAGIWSGLAESLGAEEASPVEVVTALQEKMLGIMVTFRQGMIDAFAGAIAGIDWAAVGWNFTAMLDSITVKILETDWSNVGRSVAQAIASIFSGAGENASSIDWSALVSAARTAVESIDWSMIAGGFNGLGSAILNAIKGVIGGVIEELGKATGAGAAIDAAQDAAGAAGQAVNDTIGGIGAAWNGAFGGGERLGTSFAPGGLTLVGENGPELVNMPRGASVTNNRELQGLSGGAQIVINAAVANDVDIERLALRIKQVMDRRG